MHEFVLSDLSAGDERGVKIMARHRVSLPRDAQHHSVSRVWERFGPASHEPQSPRPHVALACRLSGSTPTRAVTAYISYKVQRCVPSALSIIPLSLVAAAAATNLLKIIIAHKPSILFAQSRRAWRGTFLPIPTYKKPCLSISSLE
jgi:hypothetical protein